MNHFSLNELARKDFFVCLGIWLSLEFVAFVLFPALGMITPSDRMHTWLLTSLPLGLGGAFLLGFSSHFIAISNELADKGKRSFRIMMGQFSGWIGLLGIGFPIMMASLELFTSAFSKFSGA